MIRALLQLETLVSNWLVRTAELISAELLDACGAWPELRRYLLGERYLATRELERLRNQLNPVEMGSLDRRRSALRKPSNLVPASSGTDRATAAHRTS